MGRGVFADRDFRKGQLLSVETSIAEASLDKDGVFTFIDPVYMADNTHTDLTSMCSNLHQLKGLEALKISYLYDGRSKSSLKLPPMELFTQNKYKKFKTIPDMYISQISRII
jgi:hypothetical protein